MEINLRQNELCLNGAGLSVLARRDLVPFPRVNIGVFLFFGSNHILSTRVMRVVCILCSRVGRKHENIRSDPDF